MGLRSAQSSPSVSQSVGSAAAFEKVSSLVVKASPKEVSEEGSPVSWSTQKA